MSTPVAQVGRGAAVVPDLEAVRALGGAEAAAGGADEPRVPVVRRLYGDLETPVSAYLKLVAGATDQGYSFLLESVHGGEHPARWSFLGAAPAGLLQVPPGEGNPLAALGAQAGAWRIVQPTDAREPLPPFVGGAVGFVGYEAAGTFEPVPSAAHDAHGLPLALFGLYDTVVAFDHAYGVMQVISLASLAGDVDAAYAAAVARIDAVCARLAAPLPPVQSGALSHHRPGAVGQSSALDRGPGAVGQSSALDRGPGAVGQSSALDRAQAPRNAESNCAPGAYEAMVERAKEHIAAGDIIQVVLSQRFTRPTDAAPFAVYRALRALNPSPYMFYLQLGDFQLIGASP